LYEIFSFLHPEVVYKHSDFFLCYEIPLDEHFRVTNLNHEIPLS